MVRPVRLAANVILGLLLIAGCSEQHAPVHLSNVEANDARLSMKNDTLFIGSQHFSGSVYQLNAKRDTIASDQYRDGRLNGWSIKRYDATRIAEQRHYSNGRRDSIHEGWWPNGLLKFRYHYRDDEMDGIAEDFYPDGAPFRKLNYAMGHESGLQQLWRNDGVLYANYVVRDGRKYGLTGSKECANVYSDVEKNN